MKVSALSLFAGLFFVLGSPAFSADITITGPDIVTGSGQFTFYATPVVAGATYTWQPGWGTIVAQNTDPAAGPIYITLDYPSILAEDAVEIADNQGNSGIHWIEIWGWAYTRSVILNPIGAGYSFKPKTVISC